MVTKFRVPTSGRGLIARWRHPTGLILLATAVIAWIPFVLIGYVFWLLLQHLF